MSGIFMGAEKLKGIGSKQIRDLVAEIKAQQAKAKKAFGGFNILDQITNVVKTLAPGVGHGIDLVADTIGKQYYAGKAGDAGKIREKETAYTGEGYADEFGSMLTEFKGNPLLDLASSAVSYLGTDIGKGFAKDFSSKLFGDGIDWRAEEGVDWDMEQGGYISPKKYYGGGSVSSGTPTISEYFSMQNKTLGGSNTSSLAEILGRK